MHQVVTRAGFVYTRFSGVVEVRSAAQNSPARPKSGLTRGVNQEGGACRWLARAVDRFGQ